MGNKKDVAVAFGVTESYVDILATALVGLKRHSKKFWDDVVVFHNGITEDNQKKLNLITECKFILVRAEDLGEHISANQLRLYSVATFFRYESFKLLKDYKKVIWSDVDVLFQKDLNSLLTYGDTTGFAATYAAREIGEYRVEDNFFELINEYDMFVPMVNAGIYVLTDKIDNYKEIVNWCYRKTKEYGSKLRMLDQGILNLMLQEFDIEVEELDLKKYHCHPNQKKDVKKASVVHAYGIKKFWNDINYMICFPQWYENYNEWLKISNRTTEDSMGLIREELPFVTVVMSVYERYDFLDDAVRSILDQTYKNFELIIVVEYSDYQQEIAGFLEKYNDERIKVFNNDKKLGFSASLNIGIDNAKGKYIARMDDDDISLLERFEKQVQFMEDNTNIGICGTNAEFFMYREGFWSYGTNLNEEIRTILLVTNPICHPSVMMRTEMINHYNLRYDINYFAEDYEFWTRAIEHFPIVNMDEVLLRYRYSKKNISSLGVNDRKIQNSLKKTIHHQFLEHLGLDFNDNELELVQRRKNFIDQLNCRESALKLREELYAKIIAANEKLGYYDHQLLCNLFGVELKPQLTGIKKITTPIITGVKQGVKSIFKPFYRAFEVRMYGILYNENLVIKNRIDSIKEDYNLRLEKIEEKLDELVD